MPKICFVADGSPTMGMGHVQQAMTLAKELKGQAEVSFLTKSDEPILSMIRDAGFRVTRLEGDTPILDHLATLDPHVVVFDKIDVDERLAIAIKANLRAALVIFTNLTDANKHADVAVTADIGSRFDNVVYRDSETETLYYYGPKYWVLRSEFHEYKLKGKARPSRAEHILLIFGGSDPSNLTSAALGALLTLETVPTIEVVLGAHFRHEGSVNQVLSAHPKKAGSVKIHRNIKDVAKLMYSADLVVASPGLSAFEALCVGTPVIVMPQDDLQRDTYRGFMRILEKGEVGQIGALIEQRDFTYPDEEHIARMEIGDGASELVELILSLAKR